MTQELICESCMSIFNKDVWFPDPMRPEILICMREAGNSSMIGVGDESMAEERTLEDSALCGLGTAESHLK